MDLRNGAIPRPYVRVFVLRTAIVWIVLHIPSLALTGIATHTPRAALLALGFTVFVLLIDAERRNERRFLANLGVSKLSIGLVVVLTALVLELVLGLIPQPLLDGLRQIPWR